MLPPSLGDPDLAGFAGILRDDLAPEMSKIVYAVKVRIAHQRGTEDISILGEKMKKVRIKPALVEQPPLNIDGNKEYRPREEKTVRKGLFKGKLGTLSAQSVQPKALVIAGARSSEIRPITTMAKLLLRFDPTDESSKPPKLGSLATKLKVTTYYASSPRQNFPNCMTLGFDVTQGAYSENVALTNLCIASPRWERQTVAANIAAEDFFTRCDSGVSDRSTTTNDEAIFASGILPATKDYKNGTFYTTQILVPITLPTNKYFIPTFHSCLVSRTYTLGMQFSAQGGSNFNIKVPIQICAEGSDTGVENARARSVEETILREAAEAWTPRSVAPPSFEESRRNSVAPPNFDTVSRYNSDAPPRFEEINIGPRRHSDAPPSSARGLRNNSIGASDELPPDYSAFAPPARRYRTSIAA